MNVLVTGGAGYIGSHIVHALNKRGDDVTVVDDLSTGSLANLSPGIAFFRGNVGNKELLTKIIRIKQINAVVHCAAFIDVAESMREPKKYYDNNTATMEPLLAACTENGVQHFVFSSTAAVYGEPETIPVPENAGTRPISPYGKSKLEAEKMLLRTARTKPKLTFMILRYFNVAGGDLQGPTMPSKKEVTHLIRKAVQVMLGNGSHIDIYGTDYPTPDGTAIRDYIHILDLVAIHLKALDALERGEESRILNCGYGMGFSVKQVLTALQEVTGKALPVRLAPRRPGDSAMMVATGQAVREVLGWEPEHDSIEEIVRSAYEFEQK